MNLTNGLQLNKSLDKKTVSISGFSLLEMLMAVTITTFITISLYAIFDQTQRAFRSGLAQVDVLESGRAASEILDYDIRQIVPNPLEFRSGRMALDNSANFRGYPFNFWVDNRSTFGSLGGSLLSGNSITTAHQNVIFFHRNNDELTAVGYFNVPIALNWAGRRPPRAPVISTLYRFSATRKLSALNEEVFERILQAFLAGPIAWQKNPTRDYQYQEIISGVVQMRWSPFAPNGEWWQFIDDPLVRRSGGGSFLSGLTAGGNVIPAQVEYELMVLEEETLKQYVILGEANALQARDFLGEHVQNIHYFRKRIPTALFQ